MKTRQIQDFLEKYQLCYFDACLGIMRSNTPQFFAQDEERDFKTFLNALVEQKDANSEVGDEYYILRKGDGDIIGCGGISINFKEMIGYLRWSMIDGRYHLQKWGSLLTLLRINSLIKRFPLKELRLYTSNEVVGFYRKLGFRTIDFKKDYYREGLDRYDMLLILDNAVEKRLIEHELLICSKLHLDSDIRTVASC